MASQPIAIPSKVETRKVIKTSLGTFQISGTDSGSLSRSPPDSSTLNPAPQLDEEGYSSRDDSASEDELDASSERGRRVHFPDEDGTWGSPVQKRDGKTRKPKLKSRPAKSILKA